MTELLNVRDFSIRFRSTAPVRDVSFTAKAGEMLAIVGESGSGKTLIALGLMGLLPPPARVSGEIVFDSRDLNRLSERELRRIRGRDIAMVFQEPTTSLNPVLTIGEQIVEALRAHTDLTRRQAWARAVELLDLVGIPDAVRRVDDYPHRLSGGARQRVMIAIAIACDPKLLVADEPTTALDVTIQARVLQLLDDLRLRLNMTVILITHDLGVVGQWADRVVAMYAGRIVEEGPVDHMLESPLHPYTRGLISSSPRLGSDYHYRDGPLWEIPGSITSAADEEGCPFRPRCPIARPQCGEQVPRLLTAPHGRQVACPYVSIGQEAVHATPLG